MPGRETDTQTIPCSEVETDAAGNPVTLDPANVVWAIDDPTIATLTQNPDGSATFKAVKPVPPATNPRTANVSCTDTKTGVVGTDTLEVDDSPTQPGKMILTFGTPA
jgi:phospholipase C